MKINEGTTDRVIRGIVAVAALALAVFIPMSAIFQIVLGIVGALLAITALTGFCGLYALLGMSTCPATKKPLP